MANMTTSRPARKVVAASLASAFVTMLLQVSLGGVEGEPMLPVLTSALTAAIVFVVGYVVPPAECDQVVPTALLPS